MALPKDEHQHNKNDDPNPPIDRNNPEAAKKWFEEHANGLLTEEQLISLTNEYIQRVNIIPDRNPGHPDIHGVIDTNPDPESALSDFIKTNTTKIEHTTNRTHPK